MRVPVPRELLDFISKGDNFIIAGHKEPDGDCIGSQLALASALRRLGKRAVVCSAGPFDRTEIAAFSKDFCSCAEISAKLQEFKNRTDKVQVIIVDCSAFDRTGDLKPVLEKYPYAVIDHHENGEYDGQSTAFPCYLDNKAPSTTFLVFMLICALGLEATREEAEFLFFGLCTDTGFFRHVKFDADTFDTAAALIRRGASPKAAYSAIHDGKSLNSRKLLGAVLQRAESLFDGKLILSSEEYEETCRLGSDDRDSDSMYKLLQTVAGVEAIVIIRQEKPERCSIGFRSRSYVDVGRIAESFGGGGHKNAAGCSTAGTIAELRPKIIKAFSGIFENH